MKVFILYMVILNLSTYFLTSKSLKINDKSGQTLSQSNLPSKARKIESSHVLTTLCKPQVQTTKQSSSHTSLTGTQPEASLSILPNQLVASIFKKLSASKATSKDSLSFQDVAESSTSTKKQLSANKIAPKKPKVSKSKARKVSSKNSPPNNLLGSRSTSKRISKSAAKRSHRYNSARRQHLDSKNKSRKMSPLHSVNKTRTNPKVLHTPNHHVLKHHPPPSFLIKSHSSQLQILIPESHKPISHPHQEKKQPAKNSLEAATAPYTAPNTVFEDITIKVTGGTDDIISNTAQMNPMLKAPATTLSPTTKTIACLIITQSDGTATTTQETTTLQGNPISAITETTSIIETTATETGTTIKGTDVTVSVVNPTTTAVNTNSATDTVTGTTTTTEDLKPTTTTPGVTSPTAIATDTAMGTTTTATEALNPTTAPGANTFTFSSTLSVTDITSVLPNANIPLNNAITAIYSTLVVPEAGSDVYPEYEFDPDFIEDSTVIPELSATGPVTPSTPETTDPTINNSEPTTSNTTQNP